MSTAKTSISRKHHNLNGEPVVALILFVAVAASLLYFSGRKAGFVSVLESLSLVIAGSVAIVNYSNLGRDISDLIGDENIASRLDVIGYQQILVALFLLASLFLTNFEHRPYFLPYFIAIIYLLYCFTNYRVCKLITGNSNPKTHTLPAVLILAQNFLFLSGENRISLFSYLGVVVLVLLLIGFGWNWYSIASVDELSALVAGMAIFHLFVSAVRFLLLAMRKSDDAVLEKIIDAYDRDRKKTAPSGRDLFIQLFEARIRDSKRALETRAIAVGLVGILVLSPSAPAAFAYVGHALGFTGAPHAN